MRWLRDRISSYPTTIFPDKEIVSRLASRGFYYDYDARLPTCYECEGVDEIHREECFIPRLNRLIWDLENNANNYRSLYERILTFRDGWQSNDTEERFSSPDEIACAGFLFTGHLDNLRCPFCSMIVRFSTHQQLSITEHRKLNPNCTFVKNTVMEE